MELKLCSYELAKLAKDKGFDWIPEYYYDSNKNVHKFSCYINDKRGSINAGFDLKYYAVTLELLSKWFRDVHNIILSVYYEPENVDNMAYAYCIQIRKADDSLPCYGDKPTSYSWNMNTGYWRVYEEALEKGLIKAIELI